MKQVLSGIKVLDLTWYIAGPYCTKLLADYGADVVKIEKPDGGDPARHLGPFLDDEPHPEKSGLFLHLNTNKRGITLNLKSETGKKIFRDLVKGVNILVESFNPRVMPSLGLEYEVLEKINPMLVMTSISDFGQTGPYRDFKGSELIYQGFGGGMYLMGLNDREPTKKSGNVTQYQTGAIAALATLIAYYGANICGYGDHIDVNGIRAEIISVDQKNNMMTTYQYTGHTAHRVQNMRPSVYPCKDGYVTLTGYGLPLFFPAIARLLGLSSDEIAEWGKIEIMTNPKKQAEFREQYILPWVLVRTAKEVVEQGQAAGVMTVPFNSIDGVLHDPHLREREFWAEIDHPVAGRITYPGAPFRMSEGGWQIRRPAPRLGQHNEEVYFELGYTKEDLIILRQTGVI